MAKGTSTKASSAEANETQSSHHVFSVLDIGKDCAKSRWNDVIAAATATTWLATKETLNPRKSQHEVMNGGGGDRIDFEHRH